MVSPFFSKELCQRIESAEYGLDRAGQDAQPKGLRLALSFREERHGDDRAFREVLDRDAERQSQRAALIIVSYLSRFMIPHDRNLHDRFSNCSSPRGVL